MTKNKKETPAATEVDLKVKPYDLKIKITKSDAFAAVRTVKHIINEIEPSSVSEVEVNVQSR